MSRHLHHVLYASPRDPNIRPQNKQGLVWILDQKKYEGEEGFLPLDDDETLWALDVREVFGFPSQSTAPLAHAASRVRRREDVLCARWTQPAAMDFAP